MVRQSIHYDHPITHHLGLDNQNLKLGSGEFAGELSTYLDPEGSEIIELLDDTPERRVLGHCTLKQYKEPQPIIYVSWVVKKNSFLEKNLEGKTVGDLIMEKVNTFIRAKKLPGLLYNGIDPTAPAASLYARNGWQTVASDPNWMTFDKLNTEPKNEIDSIISIIKKSDPYFANRT